MRKHGLLGMLVAASLGLIALAPASASARGRGHHAKRAAEPAVLEHAPVLKPRGLAFGQRPKAVLARFERLIDRDYKKRRQQAQPGIDMQRLRYEIDQKKQALRLSFMDFDDKPSSLDASELSREFTHNNRESALLVKRRRRHRYLFFIRKRLWKVADVYELGERSKWGEDFAHAVEKINKKLGVPGRKLAADEKAGRRFAEVDWADGTTHLRLVDWGKKLAIIFVDKATEANLGDLRSDKGKKKDEIDPSVKAILR